MLSSCGPNIKKKDWTAAPQEADAATCAARGGRIEKLSPDEYPMCVTPFPDGGKPCADASECIGGCYYYSNSHPAVMPKKKKGVCQRSNYFRECYRKVERDIIEPGSQCQA